ncbi:MAG: DUF72 domain-containing protein [Spirochaetes bacterium]|nr:MAG: DUF72 domain-containing protein [Spirochaetota bacterium]
MINIGTSGWSYKHWKGVFYPEKLPQKKWLEYYAEHFNTVEVNSSFYHIPKETVTDGWGRRTPGNFCFSIKMSRLVSHIHRLKNCKETLEWFFRNTAPLAVKTYVYLIQLPPSFCPGNEVLAAFLKELKETASTQLPQLYKTRFAFEFRNPQCYNPATAEILKNNSIAFCFHDFSEAGTDSMEKFITSGFIYIRFHGYGNRYGGSYPDTVLKDWALKIVDWEAKGFDVYTYFNNDAEGFAVQNALTLKSYIGT